MPGCAVWMVMGRGPRLPRHRGAGMSSSPWLGGEALGIPASAACGSQDGRIVGTRSSLLLCCAGTTLQGLPGALRVPVVMAAGGSILPHGGKGGHPACHLYARAGFWLAVTGSRALVSPSGMELWGAASGWGSAWHCHLLNRDPLLTLSQGWGPWGSPLWDHRDGSPPRVSPGGGGGSFPSSPMAKIWLLSALAVWGTAPK